MKTSVKRVAVANKPETKDVKFRENEKVRLRVDLPVHNLRRGSNGVVIGAFEEPDEAYEVEFMEGRSTVTCVLKPTQLEPTR